MKYIHSRETLEIPEGVKVSIKTRTVTVEGPRGTKKYSIADFMDIAANEHRQTHQRLGPSFSLLLAPEEEHHKHRVAPWHTEKCRHTSNCANPHPQPHRRRDKGLQVQDALRVRPFPHQRQHRQEQRDWSL